MSSSLLRPHLVRRLGDLYHRSSASSGRSLTASFSAASRHGGTPEVFRLLPGQRELLPRLCDQVPSRFSHMSSIVGRGAYDERTNQHVKGSDVKNLELVSDGRQLSIKWGDGKVSRFHSVWLRYNCFCPSCRMDDSGQPCMEFDKVPENSRVLSAKDDGEGCLTVQWKEDPGHTGIFPLKFLKANCYSKESLQNKRNSIRMTFSTDNVIPHVHCGEVMKSREGVYKWVKALNETGISIVDDVPCQKDALIKVCQRIADLLQNSIYGETFDVKNKPQPINAAYAPVELKLHMDLTMYEAPPGLQALHCIRFDSDIKGGDNIFVDLFHVAETFREKNPEDFHLLTQVPIPHETIHYKREWPVHMRFQRPMFRMNNHGDLTGVVWQPHLLGPLQLEEELVEPVYRALGRFYSLINNFPYMFRHRLKPGEMVIFNNRRVLHGRKAFDSTGDRYLQGCYVEISEFKSCVHLLSNLVGDGSPPIRVGDNDHQ